MTFTNGVETSTTYNSVSPSVCIENLTKLYDRPGIKTTQTMDRYIIANDNISFQVQRGEIFGLLGPNGAGKTTLVSQLLGLIKPDKGSITLEGLNVQTKPKQIKELTAYLPQSGIAFGYLEVWRALSYTGQLRNLSKNEADAQSKNLIEVLDLGTVANRYVNTLSGGMRRMVSFATALMGYPKLLILDEPTNELDPARRRMVWQVIRSINRERGSTCILVTHNVLEAESTLDRVAVIAEGKLLALGSPGELKQKFSQVAQLDLTLSLSSPIFDNFAALKRIIQESGLEDFADIKLEPHKEHSYRIAVTKEYGNQLLTTIIQKLGNGKIEDYKLALPSLEDIYLGLIQPGGKEVEDACD